MNNVNIVVREARSEVLVFIDRHMPNELSALQEAVRILQREVMYREAHPDKYIPR